MPLGSKLVLILLSVFYAFTVCLSASNPVSAWPAKNANAANRLLAMEQIQEAVRSRLKSDDQLIKDINMVADRVERITPSVLQRRPSLDEIDWSEQLSKGLGCSPYDRAQAPAVETQAPTVETQAPTVETYAPAVETQAPTVEIYARYDGSGARYCSASTRLKSNAQMQATLNSNVSSRVHFKIEPSLTPQSIDLIRKEPPADWNGNPGDIFVVHNGYDAAFVWGADGDGKPVLDRVRKRYKVIGIRFSR